MKEKDKPLIWLRNEIRTPPFSEDARLFAGFLLRKLQQSESLSMPHSRPMPIIGKRCHELRIKDMGKFWRIIYRIDNDAIIILEVFQKQKNETSKRTIKLCKKRLRQYENYNK